MYLVNKMNLYAQNIIDHYKNPRNFGSIRGADITSSENNYSCGDKINIDLKIKGDKLVDLKFNGAGCAISMAGMSILSEHIIGKTKKQILKLKLEDIQKYLGVPISHSRVKCAMIGLKAIQKGIVSHNT